MGSVSVSTLVLFIASLVIAAGVAGTLVTTVDDISSSAETTGDAISENIDTDIQIINDGKGDAFYQESNGNAEITLYIRNTGSTTLHQDSDRIDVLVNGRLIVGSNLAIESTKEDADEDAWLEAEVIEIVVTLENEQLEGDNRVTVSVNGVERSVEFRAEA